MATHGASQPFFWVSQMSACLDDLRPAFGRRQPPVVDRELMADFGGSPDRMCVWLICERREDIPRVKDQEGDLREAITRRMRARGFPDLAVRTLRTDVTSREDIEAGGGKFYFFR